MEDETTEKTSQPAGGEGKSEKPGWRKTKNGKWAIAGPADEVVPGATIEVYRKDGSSSAHKLSDSADDFGEPFDDQFSGGKTVYCYSFEEIKDE